MDSRDGRAIDAAWVAIAVVLPAIAALLAAVSTTDLAYHLRVGDLIRLSGEIPDVDTFTFTVAGTPWLDQQWGAQVIFASVHRFGGWETLVVLRALLTSTTFACVYLACRSRGATVRNASLLAVASFFVAGPTLALRPQLLALPLFAGTIWLLADRRTHPARLWLVPAFALIAANLHGTFVMFPLVLGLAWLEDVWEKRSDSSRLLVITTVSAAATLANPFGIGAWTYAWDLVTSPVIRENITEWQPVSLGELSGWMMLGSGLTVAAFLSRTRDPVPWPTILRLGLFFVLGMAAERAVVWWALVAPVEVAAHMGRQADRSGRRKPGLRAPNMPALMMIGVLVAATILLLPWLRGNASVRLHAAPPAVTQALRGSVGPGARVFAHQPWASWFEQQLPELLYFVDSRFELIPAEIWTDYDQVAFAGAGWRDVLDRWSPDAIVAEASWDLIPELRRDPGWRVVFEDEEGLVFVPAG